MSVPVWEWADGETWSQYGEDVQAQLEAAFNKHKLSEEPCDIGGDRHVRIDLWTQINLNTGRTIEVRRETYGFGDGDSAPTSPLPSYGSAAATPTEDTYGTVADLVPRPTASGAGRTQAPAEDTYGTVQSFEGDGSIRNLTHVVDSLADTLYGTHVAPRPAPGQGGGVVLGNAVVYDNSPPGQSTYELPMPVGGGGVKVGTAMYASVDQPRQKRQSAPSTPVAGPVADDKQRGQCPSCSVDLSFALNVEVVKCFKCGIEFPPDAVLAPPLPSRPSARNSAGTSAGPPQPARFGRDGSTARDGPVYATIPNRG